MKKTPVRSHSSSAAILAGGLLFTGPVGAVTIFSEGFEGGPGAGNAFAMPTYAYSQNYTMPGNAGSGINYGHGGAGVNGSVSTNTFPGGSHTLLTGGITAGQIDAGLASYSFSAQFSTYRLQNDFAQVSVQFLDGSNAAIGSPLVLGSEAFVAALPRGVSGSLPDAAGWGTDSLTGAVPALARSLSVTLLETKSPGGTNIDGYVDTIVLNVTAIPEPGTLTLSGLAAALLLRRRRR
jgi:hypothetical protein